MIILPVVTAYEQLSGIKLNCKKKQLISAYKNNQQVHQ